MPPEWAIFEERFLLAPRLGSSFETVFTLMDEVADKGGKGAAAGKVAVAAGKVAAAADAGKKVAEAAGKVATAAAKVAAAADAAAPITELVSVISVATLVGGSTVASALPPVVLVIGLAATSFGIYSGLRKGWKEFCKIRSAIYGNLLSRYYGESTANIANDSSDSFQFWCEKFQTATTRVIVDYKNVNVASLDPNEAVLLFDAYTVPPLFGVLVGVDETLKRLVIKKLPLVDNSKVEYMDPSHAQLLDYKGDSDPSDT